MPKDVESNPKTISHPNDSRTMHCDVWKCFGIVWKICWASARVGLNCFYCNFISFVYCIHFDHNDCERKHIDDYANYSIADELTIDQSKLCIHSVHPHDIFKKSHPNTCTQALLPESTLLTVVAICLYLVECKRLQRHESLSLAINVDIV